MAVAKLHLSPFVLSTAMFDNANSVGDQEGFLIGNSQKSVRREISDHSMFNTEEDLIMSIYSCIPCGSFLSFYDSFGNINEKKVEDFLGDRKRCVVGWYRYRRNLVTFPSSREMMIHKNLARLFSGNINIGNEYFTFGVLGSAAFPTPATHTYDYAFYIQRYDSFQSMPITLLNLGDTKTEYRGDSLSGSFINSTTFNSVVEIPWDFNSSWQTEDAIQQMQKMLRDKSDCLSEELTASESVNSSIEKEIKRLEEELVNLAVKEPVKTNNNEMDSENSKSIPPEKITVPLPKTHAQVFKKRCLKEVIDLNEELHPMYGKYFPQNRLQEPGCSYHYLGNLAGANYNFLPPKKKIKVILQERRRILDHDYENESGQGPSQQVVHEREEASPDTYESDGFLSSHASGFLHEEEIPSTSTKYEEPNVQVVYIDNQTNEDDILCPEAVVEEIVETIVPEDSDSDSSTTPNSPSDNSNISQENVVSRKVADNDEEIKNKEGPNTENSAKKTFTPTIVFCKPVMKKENTYDP